MNGVIVIDKPEGFTSFDVVAVVRKLSKQKKIGHTGTLDPMATGVLPLLLGNAAKAQSILPDSDKEYLAKLKFGITSDTLDITGSITSNTKSNVKKDMLLSTLENFKGKQMQLPPMYSAIKKNGVRLYDLARQGIEVEREKREINIYELELLNFSEEDQEAEIRVLCSKGTYIRSLISDIGEVLGCGAVMTALRRTKACSFCIDEAISIDEIRKLSAEKIQNRLVNVENVFLTYPALTVSDAQAIRFSNGGSLDIDRTKLKNIEITSDVYRVKSLQCEFLGLGAIDKENRVIKMFKLFNQK
ncbi:MAG: tRNA pseudouridine(55) synthase TruB [Clostridia bacterium]|nr:tRNA pseudouridine(55) synthase TruB [Clostridia bacterium]